MNQKRINVILSLVLLFALVAQIVPLNNISFAKEVIRDLSGSDVKMEGNPTLVDMPQLQVRLEVNQVRDATNQNVRPGRMFEEVGDYVIYQVRVYNTGNKVVDRVIFNDQLVKPDASKNSYNVEISPGGYRVFKIDQAYQVTQQDVLNGYLENTISVQAHVKKAKKEDPDEYTNVATSYLKIDGAEAVMAMDVKAVLDKVVKRNDNGTETAYADGRFAEVGDKVYFKLSVKNTGNKPIKNIYVESKANNFSTYIKTNLNPGESGLYHLDGGHVIDKQDALNGYADIAVVARALDSIYGNSKDESDVLKVYGQKYKEVPYETTIDAQMLVLEIQDEDGNARSCNRFQEKGDKVLYGVRVKNNGNKPITSVHLADILVGLNKKVTQNIAPGDSVLFRFDQAYELTADDFANGYAVNKVAITCYDAANSVSAQKTAAVKVSGNRIPVADPGEEKVDIAVTLGVLQVRNADQKVYADSKYEEKGDMVIYGVRIENVGTRTINRIHLRELMGLNISQAVKILPGEVLDVKVDQAYRITKADMDRFFVTNRAVVTGQYDRKEADGSVTAVYSEPVVAKVKVERNIGEKQEVGEVGGYNPIGKPSNKPGGGGANLKPGAGCQTVTVKPSEKDVCGKQLPETGTATSPVAPIAATLLLAGFVLRRKSYSAN